MSWQKHRSGENELPLGEINMVPLIDVMLVLLVIFIITAPLLTHSIPVNLPQTDRTPIQAASQSPVEITITAAGKLYYNNQAITREQMQMQLRQQAKADAKRPLHIRADEQVPYRYVAETLADMHQAGLSRIGFVSR